MAKQTVNLNRTQWLALFDAASQQPGSELNDEWEWLLDSLGLSKDHYLAVLKTLQEGRWRTAENPKAYVKTVAKRVALKMDLCAEPKGFLELVKVSTERANFSVEEELEHLAHLASSKDLFREDGSLWRRAEDSEEDYFEDESEAGARSRLSFHNLVSSGLTETIEYSDAYKSIIEEMNSTTDEFHIHLTPLQRPNWKKWAERAGFDSWDCKVLECRVKNISRDQAMKDQPNETARKALQAAWRKFDRNGAERLREALKK